MSVVADTRSLRRWLAATTTPTALLVACHEHEDLGAWRVPLAGQPRVVYRLAGCLADAPPAALLEMLAAGAVSVTGLLDGCADPSAAGRVLRRAGQIAAAVTDGQSIDSVTEAPAVAAGSTGVRERTARFRRPAADAGQLAVLDARAMPLGRRALAGLDGALGDLDAHPGQRLYSVVRELLDGAPLPSSLAEIATGAAQLDAAQCCGSGACVLTCPTQALTLTITDLVDGDSPEPAVIGAAAFSADAFQQFALTVDPALCIDCGKCIELCPESAMTRVGPLPWPAALSGLPTTLRVGIVARCTRCGMPNGTSGQLCSVCAFRTSDPFGSRLPPGFTRTART